MSLPSRKTGSDVFKGLFSAERTLRRLSPDAGVAEPASSGSAELIPPRSIPAIAIAGFVHCQSGTNGPARHLFPPGVLIRRGGCLPIALGRRRYRMAALRQ